MERRIAEIEARKKQVERELADLSRKVDEIDTKIRAYLADRQRNPHPRHTELIERVQGYRIDPAVFDKHLETMLDNLQWKIHYSRKAWQQLWDVAEKARRPGVIPGEEPSTEAGDGDTLFQEKSRYSIDSLWEIQQGKLKQYGQHGQGESKVVFKERIINEYKNLSEKRKDGQEIVMTYDIDKERCRLDLKQR